MNLQRYEVTKAPPTVFYIPDFITIEEEKSILDHVNSAPKPKWTQLSNRRLQNWGGVPHSKGMIPEKLPEWLTHYTQRIGELGLFEEGKCPNHVLVNEYKPGQGIMKLDDHLYASMKKTGEEEREQAIKNGGGDKEGIPFITVTVDGRWAKHNHGYNFSSSAGVPHTDGPVFHPIITTISCGSHTVLNFHHPRSDQADTQDAKLLSLLLEQRSLLVVRDTMYHNYMHSIQEATHDVVTGDEANLELCGGCYEMGQQLERSTRVSLTIRLVPNTSRFQLRLGR